MINIAICDDEEHFCTYEKQLVMDYMTEQGCECCINTFLSGKELLESEGRVFPYHIVFLDIEMNDVNGIEIAKEIRKYSKNIFLVFVTAYVVYSLEGYKVDAIRFLIKDRERLAIDIKETLDTIMKKIKYVDWKLCWNFVEGKRLIRVSDIEYIESNLHKLSFYVREDGLKKYTIYDKLDSIEAQLDDISFCRIHKSFLVNLKYVKAIKNEMVFFEDGRTLNIAKRNRYEVMDQYVAYRGGI
ncbi:MAG: response regulator transcription factor [Lachnospiraceae bacterium]|nr:response regulator transcription factor [Lachnospiraceae bacterium]